MQVIIEFGGQLAQAGDVALPVAAHGKVVSHPQLLEAQVAFQLFQKAPRAELRHLVVEGVGDDHIHPTLLE